MKTEHTPTPWRVSPNSNSNLLGADNTFIAKLDFKMSYDEANAALIVRAVNSFEAMKEALENLTKRYCDLVNCGDCGFWEPEDEKEIIASRAALKLAKGEQP